MELSTDGIVELSTEMLGLDGVTKMTVRQIDHSDMDPFLAIYSW